MKGEILVKVLGNKKWVALMLCGALFFAGTVTDFSSVKAEDSLKPGTDTSGSTGSAVTTEVPVPTATPEPTAVPTATPEPTPSVDVTTIVSMMKISNTTVHLMNGKKKTLTLSLEATGDEANDTTKKTYLLEHASEIVWSSSDETVAVVTGNGLTASVKGVKKGTAEITAKVWETEFKCTFSVVAKMGKKDFGKFNGENFVNFCQRKNYDKGYAWAGQWLGGSKKKTTYRGVKVGNKKSKVNKLYGDLSWKKCSSKDPFTKMKGLKKNKVKKYGDVTYGKYRIRFYLNKSNKVVAIILACNIGKIKKKALKGYL